MQTIQISDIPAQSVSVTLGGQSCDINLYVKSSGMYCDLYVSGKLIVAGVACQNLNRIVRNAYFGFIGDLIFNDTQGKSDPTYPGLNTRYQLIYLEAADLAGVQT